LPLFLTEKKETVNKKDPLPLEKIELYEIPGVKLFNAAPFPI